MLGFSCNSRFLHILLSQSVVSYLPFLWHRGRRNGHLPYAQSRPVGGRCKAVLQQCPAGIDPHRWHWPELRARWSPPQTLHAGLQWKPKQEQGSGHRTGLCVKTLILFISGPFSCEKCLMNYLWYCSLLGKEITDGCLPQKSFVSYCKYVMWKPCSLKNQNKAATDVHSLQHAMTLYLKRLETCFWSDGHYHCMLRP